MDRSDSTESETCVKDSETVKRTLSGTRHMLRLWLRSTDDELVWETPEPLEKNSYTIYGDSESRRIGKWDVHRAPPINRVLKKYFSYS